MIGQGQLLNVEVQQIRDDIDATVFGDTQRVFLPRRSTHIRLDLEVTREAHTDR